MRSPKEVKRTSTNKIRKITRFAQLTEDDRESVVGAIENLGMDIIFSPHGSRLSRTTSDVFTMCHAAWELLADGYGEDKGHKALIDEINAAFKRERR